MTGLRGARTRLARAARKRSQRFKRASLFAKGALIAGGSAVASFMQFTQVQADGTYTGFQVTGMVASLIVAVGAVFVLITEDDATEEMFVATRAIGEAHDIDLEARTTISEQDDLLAVTEYRVEQMIELFNAYRDMRRTVEGLLVAPPQGDDSAIEKILLSCDRRLALALGFDQADKWTICIYKAEANGAVHTKVMRCLAHHRAVKCDLGNTRKWPEGKGIAGISYSNNAEIILPDLQAPGLEAVFGAGEEKKRDDLEQYRSMCAVPIRIQGTEKPWGIVTATNNVLGHFSDNEDDRIRAEAIRALADMIELYLAARQPTSGAGPATGAKAGSKRSARGSSSGASRPGTAKKRSGQPPKKVDAAGGVRGKSGTVQEKSAL